MIASKGAETAAVAVAAKLTDWLLFSAFILSLAAGQTAQNHIMEWSGAVLFLCVSLSGAVPKQTQCSGLFTLLASESLAPGLRSSNISPIRLKWKQLLLLVVCCPFFSPAPAIIFNRKFWLSAFVREMRDSRCRHCLQGQCPNLPVESWLSRDL